MRFALNKRHIGNAKNLIYAIAYNRINTVGTVNGKSSLSEYNSKYKAKKGCLPIRDTQGSHSLEKSLNFRGSP